MDGSKADSVRFELADIVIYLVRLADVLGTDVLVAAKASLLGGSPKRLRCR
jgi:hypothetical protein